MDSMDIIIDIEENIPKTLTDLLKCVQENVSNTEGNTANALVYTIRKYKFWPALQVKKFYSNPNLVLLHNTYKRIDVAHFQDLYDECRSVILDLNLPIEKQVVVSFATYIPERVNDMQYENMLLPSDKCEESYEGTVVTVYKYGERWFMGTSSCPTVDSSRFFHPTKTHGNMFDEALAKIFNVAIPTDKSSSIALRTLFTDSLDSSKAYAFILVHYQNSHAMDYTPLFGNEYAKLIHIIQRSCGSIVDDEISVSKPFANIGIGYTQAFESPMSALDYIRSGACTYGMIVTADTGARWKVSLESIVKREESDLGNSNVWHNMLAVYIQNKLHYKISDYQTEFCPDLEIPKNSRGQELAPTYLIHTVIITMRDILVNAYMRSTTFNTKIKRYWMDKQVDADFAPMIRFHLAQLRNLQITTHTHAMMSPKAIYDYICHHQTLKNLRLMIKFFATKWFQDSMNKSNVPTHTAECFAILDKLLSN